MPAGFRIWAWVGWCVKPYFQRQPSILSKGHGNYAFGYNEDHATGGTFRKEKGGPGVQVGSYGLRDHDGRMRTVNYVADALGFRASISTNEPGTDVKQDPAATNFNYGGGHIAAPIVAAPLAHGPILGHGAPLAHAAPIAHAPIASSYSVPTPAPYRQTDYSITPLPFQVHTQHASIAAPLAHGHGLAAPLAHGPIGAPLGHY